MKMSKQEVIMLVWHASTWLFVAAMVITSALALWDRYRPR